jgi:hypothetical protein
MANEKEIKYRDFKVGDELFFIKSPMNDDNYIVGDAIIEKIRSDYPENLTSDDIEDQNHTRYILTIKFLKTSSDLRLSHFLMSVPFSVLDKVCVSFGESNYRFFVNYSDYEKHCNSIIKNISKFKLFKPRQDKIKNVLTDENIQ